MIRLTLVPSHSTIAVVPAAMVMPVPLAPMTCIDPPVQVLRTAQFYMVWLTFVFSALAGLMTIGVIKLFGI